MPKITLLDHNLVTALLPTNSVLGGCGSAVTYKDSYGAISTQNMVFQCLR